MIKLKNHIKMIIKKYYKYIIIAFVLVVLFVGGIVVNGSTQDTNHYNFINDDTISVTIIGEVRYPNVYTLPSSSTVSDLIDKAGGLLDNADTSLLNTKQKLKNNQIIRILKKDKDIQKININTASINELMELKGIGEMKAYNIVLYRTINGPFKDVNDLLNVDGITSKILFEIINEIKLS